MTANTKFNIKALVVVVVILIALWVFIPSCRNEQPADSQGTTEVQPQ